MYSHHQQHLKNRVIILSRSIILSPTVYFQICLMILQPAILKWLLLEISISTPLNILWIKSRNILIYCSPSDFCYWLWNLLHSASLIDHVSTNTKSNLFETAILTSDISDHFTIIFFSKICSQPHSNKLIKFGDFSDANIQKFSTALRNINWEFFNTFDSTQDAYDYFSETFFSLYNLYFPECSKLLNKNIHLDD